MPATTSENPEQSSPTSFRELSASTTDPVAIETDLEDAAPRDDLTPEQLAALWAEEEPPAAGPWANLGASLVVLAFGVAGIFLSQGLGVGSPTRPGAGMWPLLVSVIIVALSLVQLIIGRRGGHDGEKFNRYSLITLIGFITLIGMVWLMPMIGFEIPALLMCVIWMKFLGGESWRSTAIYSALIVVAFYLIFITALGTSIPHLF